jgi:rhodanese-related sulfurtransferase
MALTANDLVSAARKRIREIPVTTFAAQPPRDCVLIDVREPEEFAAGHLPGAINLPRGVLEFRIEAHPAMACATTPALADRSRTLVMVCLTGGRSALAADSLQQLGFEQVYSLAGGLNAWREAALPL